MKRLIGFAASLLVAPVIAASMATTAAASTTIPTFAHAGQFWYVTTPHLGCENVRLEAGHKFVADELHDKGSWNEPAQSTITLNWRGGDNRGTVFEGTFSGGHYNGHIAFANGNHSSAKLVMGTHSGC
jgi:hypothetical protein